MSFIKVKDPRKREELIRDFIETRKRIKDNFIAKKVGEAEYQTGLTKLFKPVTETQKATTKEITEAQKAAAEKITQELLPIKEGIKGLPGAISEAGQSLSFPALGITEEQIKEKNLGPIVLGALEYLKPEKKTTFGMYFKDGDFRIGDKKIDIKGDDIKIEDKEYTGTPGLWELIMKDNPQNFTEEDYLNYGRILKQTNTIYQKNNPNQNRAKSSGGDKWKNLIKPIWEDIKKRKKEEEEYEEYEEPATIPFTPTSGTGLSVAGQSLKGTGLKRSRARPKILPSDPNALIDRFDLLFSSQKAGHTGVRNEIVSILDELKRQGVLKTNEYKKLNSLIKK